MVNPTQLEALDLLLWVGNGLQAARITSLSQPTISRSAHHLARREGLTLQKVCCEWHVLGNREPLVEERHRRQEERLAGRGPLRLEAGAVSSRILADPAPESWILGRPDAINQPRSLALLRQRVIDAWLCTSALDLPADLGEEISVMELFRTPLLLVASPSHPLCGESGLRAPDLARFPSVALEGNWYPRSQAQLQRLGLWRDPRRLSHYRALQWEGRTAHRHTLAYASPVMVASNASLRPLAFDLGLEQVLALVVRSEHREHPQIQELREKLQKRVGLLQPGDESSARAA